MQILIRLDSGKLRFPSVFKPLLDAIRASGIIPGVWFEPQVIGVRSVMVKQLLKEAFFRERGEKIVERGRYQLDYRHPAVIEGMNKVVDNLVLDYGVGYFKYEYNIEVIQGTDLNASSTGQGQLDYSHAYFDWISKLYDRYPSLAIESCSSGAQIVDYAMLAER